MALQALRPLFRPLMYIIAGYLSGSVLYARVFARLLHKENIIEESSDHNPGTANAFKHGGLLCGVLTLVCDLLKSFLPVFMFVTFASQRQADGAALALVMAAPVLGHVLPLFYHFQGGKGIAASFGSLLGLLPTWQPVGLLIVLFLFFSLILKITPHYQRTLVTYGCGQVGMFFVAETMTVAVGFFMISLMIILKMLSSKEEKEPTGVQLLWMR